VLGEAAAAAHELGSECPGSSLVSTTVIEIGHTDALLRCPVLEGGVWSCQSVCLSLSSPKPIPKRWTVGLGPPTPAVLEYYI
jgi:hypothetical protein